MEPKNKTKVENFLLSIWHYMKFFSGFFFFGIFYLDFDKAEFRESKNLLYNGVGNQRFLALESLSNNRFKKAKPKLLDKLVDIWFNDEDPNCKKLAFTTIQNFIEKSDDRNSISFLKIKITEAYSNLMNSGRIKEALAVKGKSLLFLKQIDRTLNSFDARPNGIKKPVRMIRTNKTYRVLRI